MCLYKEIPLYTILVLPLQVEYDLPNSRIDDIKLMSIDRIEQSAVPLAVAWYPPLTVESFILTSNDQVYMYMYTDIML